MLFYIRIIFIGVISFSIPLLIKKDYFKISQIVIGIAWLFLLTVGQFKGLSQEHLIDAILIFFPGWVLGSMVAVWNHMQEEIEESRLLHERFRHKKE